MKENVAFPIGNLAIIDKVDGQTKFFDLVLGGLKGRSKTFIPCIKLLMYNRLGDCLSIHRLLRFIPDELSKLMGFRNQFSERTVYRTLERLGNNYQLVLENYQKWIQRQQLVDSTQLIDFTSSYFEGLKCPLGELGYSRDREPGKLQLTLGFSLGLNEMPTALTIQKGNVQDKIHLRKMLKICSKILSEGSLLIFNCGANTKKTKEKVRKLGFHYLTLKAKKRTPYLQCIRNFWESQVQVIAYGDQQYYCVKKIEEGEVEYVFFSKKLREDQLQKKKKKFLKALEKGRILLKKVKKGKELGQHVCPEGWIVSRGSLQKTLHEVENPFVTRLE